MEAFDQALTGAGRRSQAGRLRFIFMFDDKKWQKAIRKVHPFIDKHVARPLAETKPGTDTDTEGDTSTPQRYILIHEMAKQIRDPVELRFQVLNVFLPARDSTGIAISNVIFNLARHPDIWAELREQALALWGYATDH